MAQSLKVTLVAGMTEVLIQISSFVHAVTYCWLTSKVPLVETGFPDMSERAWEWGKGHWVSFHCEKVFVSITFLFCPETMCLQGGLSFGTCLLLGYCGMFWLCCEEAVGFLSLLLVWIFLCSLWREKALSRDVIILDRDAFSPVRGCSLFLNFWNPFLFSCWLGALLWDENNFYAWGTLKSEAGGILQWYKNFSYPEFEVWYSHRVCQALTLLAKTRWQIMNYFYPTGFFLPGHYSYFKFSRLATKYLLILTMSSAGLEL